MMKKQRHESDISVLVKIIIGIFLDGGTFQCFKNI